MTGVITTQTVNTFKQQILQGCHCFQSTLVQTGNTFNANNLVNNLASTSNLMVGMSMSGTNIPSNTFLAYFVNSTAVVMSNNATGVGQPTITFAGDTFKMALIKYQPTDNYNSTNTSTYANLTTASDEVSGNNYTAGGFTLTNVNPSVPDSNTAIVTFSANPSWTSATINAAGAMIYNASPLARFGNGSSNNTISCHDFGGQQVVTYGTFTVTLPTANGTVALLRIS